MLNRRRIIIIFVLIFVILAVAVYFWLSQRDAGGPDLTNLNQTDLPGAGLPAGEPGTETPGTETPTKVVTQADKDKTEIQNTAKFFVAMLGSYSPDARFQNIIDLKPMMTTRMKAWADNFISQNLDKLDEYNERITTQVFKTEMISYNNQAARVLLQTRREKIDEQGEILYNQAAEAALIKLGGKWLVDEVEWK